MDQIIGLMNTNPIIRLRHRVKLGQGGPRDPKSGWVDSKMDPISDSSLNLRNNSKLNPLLGLGQAPGSKFRFNQGQVGLQARNLSDFSTFKLSYPYSMNNDG